MDHTGQICTRHCWLHNKKGEAYPLKSQISHERVLVRYWNLTKKKVALIWLDFRGHPVPYKILEPTTFLDVTTFVNHLWIFVDIETGDRLLGNKEYVYIPEPMSQTRRALPTSHAHLDSVRILVIVMVPLYSLLDLCLHFIRDHLEDKENISLLEIPASVKSDLKILFDRKQCTPHYFIH